MQRKRIEKANGKERGRASDRHSIADLYIYRYWTKVSIFRNLMYSKHTRAKIFSSFFPTSHFYCVLFNNIIDGFHLCNKPISLCLETH